MRGYDKNLTMDILNLSVVTGVTIGITEAVKQAFLVPNRFVPLLALAVGVGLSLVFIGLSTENALTGIFAGLSGVGLYSGSRNTIGL